MKNYDPAPSQCLQSTRAGSVNLPLTNWLIICERPRSWMRCNVFHLIPSNLKIPWLNSLWHGFHGANILANIWVHNLLGYLMNELDPFSLENTLSTNQTPYCKRTFVCETSNIFLFLFVFFLLQLTVVHGPPKFSLTIQRRHPFPCPATFVPGRKLLTNYYN